MQDVDDADDVHNPGDDGEDHGDYDDDDEDGDDEDEDGEEDDVEEFHGIHDLHDEHEFMMVCFILVCITGCAAYCAVCSSQESCWNYTEATTRSPVSAAAQPFIMSSTVLLYTSEAIWESRTSLGKGFIKSCSVLI